MRTKNTCTRQGKAYVQYVQDIKHDPLPQEQGIEGPGKKMSSIGLRDLEIRA